MIIRPGGLVIDPSYVYEQIGNSLDRDPSMANTVWTWYSLVNEQEGFFLYLFTLARKLDAARALWDMVYQECDKVRTEPAPVRRQGFLMALSEAELAIIELHRALEMLLKINGVFSLGLEVPDYLHKLERVFRDMRDTFEHIDERSADEINQAGQMDAEALSIFDQPDFLETSMLHYRGRANAF